MNAPIRRHPASYRDPAGFVFEQDGEIFRQVNTCYKAHYDKLMTSGLHARLIHEGLLIDHEEVLIDQIQTTYKVIKPKRIEVITEPWTWTYDMLKDAGCLTLKIQQISLEYGMTLKDAHPANVQFQGCVPIFIDTLSFEIWDERTPWVAYRQYVESFLLPLIIGHYIGPSSPKLIRSWEMGIPIQIGKKMLPWRTRLNFHWLLHIYVNTTQSISKNRNATSNFGFTAKRMNDLVISLIMATRKCETAKSPSGWTSYEEDVNKRGQYTLFKLNQIIEWDKNLLKIDRILDLGANTGLYSMNLMKEGQHRILIESDETICNLCYNRSKKDYDKNSNIICLNIESLLLHANNNLNLSSLSSELVLCLGLLHHLLYRANMHLDQVLTLLADLTNKYLMIEFIEYDDPLIHEYFNCRLVQERKVDKDEFVKHLSKYFSIIDHNLISDSSRTLFLCEVK